MLFTLLIITFFDKFQICQGISTYEEEYRGNYVPSFIDTELGSQIVAPDTPYVAASGRNRLYFIDTRYDVDTAQHIKNQIERAMVGQPDEYISIDETAATAEVKNINGSTVFVFDPPYARVLFAEGMNRHNPSLKLPEHEPAGDWEVNYDLKPTLAKRVGCSDYGCITPGDCTRQAPECTSCHHYYVDNECDLGQTNAIGVCIRICSKAVDTPRQDGETDASYYKRMDKLHWS